MEIRALSCCMTVDKVIGFKVVVKVRHFMLKNFLSDAQSRELRKKTKKQPL